MRQIILLSLGLLLFIFLFTEEFTKVLNRLRELLHQYPRLKFFAYPLGVMLAIIGVFLILSSLIDLLFSTPFSYE